MYKAAILIGIYSYLIFNLGLLGLLYPKYILFLTLLFTSFSIAVFNKDLLSAFRSTVEFVNSARNVRLNSFILLILIFAGGVNLIGVLSPEFSFDALWYHLALPKIFLNDHSIHFIDGGLFYYSLMPKLIDLLFIPALALHSEVLAKLIHFSFGILCAIAVYRLARLYLDEKYSLLAGLVFYTNIAVLWLSTTAYIDLGRTFFEIMALLAFIDFHKNGKRHMFYLSSVLLGLAISSKLLAVGSLLIFGVLIFYFKKNFRKSVPDFVKFSLLSLFIASPWFVFSLKNTGNPIYPLFTKIYEVTSSVGLLNPIIFVQDFVKIFLFSDDPISPIYLIFIPLIFLFRNKLNGKVALLLIYTLVSYLVWYLTPRTGGGRFIVAYLSAFSVIVVYTLKSIEFRNLRKFLTVVVILVAFLSVGYRLYASQRNLPYLFGKETKGQFLTKNLNFSFGDFYDTDGYFKSSIKPTDNVLLFGFHNLYYVDFNFTHSTFIKKGEKFNYIATQNSPLPERFSYWDLVYSNPQTGVNLYSAGGREWMY